MSMVTRGRRAGIGGLAVATLAAALTMAPRASAFKPRRSAAEREAAVNPSTAVICNHNAGNAPMPITCEMAFTSGPVISNVNIVPVFWTYGGNTVDSTITSWAPAYLSALANSTYLDLLSEYSAGGQSITRGTTTAPYTITPTTATTAAITDKAIPKELAAQVAAGHLPAVTKDAAGNANTLYMIFFPSGVVITDSGGSKSCIDYCGYHSSGASGGETYLYAVIPDLSEVMTYPRSDGGTVTEPCGYGCTYQGKTKPEVDWFNGTISHELAEAVSDPVGGNGWYDGTNQDFACGGTKSTNPPVTGGGEIGDVCVGYWDDEFGTGSCEDTLPVSGTNIAAQQLWSNALSGCYMANAATPEKCPPMGCVDGGLGPISPPLLDAGTDDDGSLGTDDGGGVATDASAGMDATLSADGGGTSADGSVGSKPDAGDPPASDAGNGSGPGTGGTGNSAGCSCTNATSTESTPLAFAGALTGIALAVGRRRARRKA
jgi:hypothetical protein